MTVEDILDYCVIELKIPSGLTIEITYDDISEDETGYSYKIDTNHYIIGLNRYIPKEEGIRTILHEMSHIKQQAIGKYVVEEGMNGKRLWEGEEYDLPYHMTPWEIDANADEDRIFSMWCESNKMESFSWKKKELIHVT